MRNQRQISLIGLFLILICQTAPALPSDYLIQEIRFIGNSITRPETLLRELSFKVGKRVSEAEIERGQDLIMSLGLFTKVGTWLEPLEVGHRLWVEVDEKRFLLPLPILSVTGDGDWIYGASMQADNLFGLNQQLKATLRRKSYHQADVEQEDRLQVRYSLPRVAGSLFDLGIVFGLERMLLDEHRDSQIGQYERSLATSQLRVSRWLKTTGSSSGWRLSAAIQQQAYKHELLSGDSDLFFDVDVTNLIARIEKRTVVESAMQRAGDHYGYELQNTLQGLAGGPHHARQFFFYKNYSNLKQLGGANFHTQLRAGACTRSIFGDPCFSLGGATTIRGIRRDAVEGDAFVLANFQLLLPVMGQRFLRGVVFLDTGTTASVPARIAVSELEYGAGFGFIWKMRSFVRTDIRLEIAHGFGDYGDNRAYAATTLLF